MQQTFTEGGTGLHIYYVIIIIISCYYAIWKNK